MKQIDGKSMKSADLNSEEQKVKDELKEDVDIKEQKNAKSKKK